MHLIKKIGFRRLSGKRCALSKLQESAERGRRKAGQVAVCRVVHLPCGALWRLHSARQVKIICGGRSLFFVKLPIVVWMHTERYM